GNPRSARRDFDRGLTLDPRNPRALLGLAHLARPTDPRAALGLVDRALAADPDFLDAIELPAQLRASLGDPSALHAPHPRPRPPPPHARPPPPPPPRPRPPPPPPRRRLPPLDARQ